MKTAREVALDIAKALGDDAQLPGGSLTKLAAAVDAVRDEAWEEAARVNKAEADRYWRLAESEEEDNQLDEAETDEAVAMALEDAAHDIRALKSAGSPKGVEAPSSAREGKEPESPSATGMEPGQRCTREENHRDMFGKTGHMFIAWEDADWHYHYGTERFRCPYIQPSPALLVTAEPPRCAVPTADDLRRTVTAMGENTFLRAAGAVRGGE